MKLKYYFFIDFNKKNECSKCITKKNLTHKTHIIHDYKFYNNTKNPFISIILDISKSNIDSFNHTFTNLSDNLFIDIQILLLHNFTRNILNNETIQLFLKDNRIETHPTIKNSWEKRFLFLFKQIESKFFILFEDIRNINKDNLLKIYNLTKGTISNIIKLGLENDNIYLIRTKAMRDAIDKHIKFKNYTDIINYMNEQPIQNLNYIPIVFCPDDYYTPLTYTSMISILITKEYYTYILFYIIIPLNFSKQNILLIESLYQQFDYFNITFLQMDNRYEKAYTNRYLTKNAFFRLSLGELLPNLNKVIYLDADTICLKDLSNLYNINFIGKIFMAKINTFKSIKSFTINTGVLLLNLKGMRKIKVEKNVLTLLNNGFKHPIFHDQAIINLYFKKYVGFLPPEFNTFTFNFNIVKQYKKDSGELYDFDSLYFAFKFPSIIHYRGDPKSKTYNQEDWYYFARKSKYFNKRSHNLTEIFNFTF